MNFEIDEYGLRFIVLEGDNGQRYLLTEYPIEVLYAAKGEVIVVPDAYFKFEEPVFVRHSETQLILEVRGHAEGRIVNYPPSPEGFERVSFERLTALPQSVYDQGKPALPGEPRKVYAPPSRAWKAIPEDGSHDGGSDIEVVTIYERRFFRLTAEAAERAVAAQRERLAELRAAEAAAAAQQREAERMAAEEAAEADRQQEEERKRVRAAETRAEQESWLASLPPQQRPGARVVHMIEARPALFEVRYDNVTLNDGQYIFDTEERFIPRTFSLECPGEWYYRRNPDGLRWPETLAVYEGPETKLGTRVPRPAIPEGQVDKCRPPFGDLLVTTVAVIGNEFNQEVGEEFRVYHALQFLKKRAPRISQTVSIPYDDDEADRGSEDPPLRSGTYQQKVMVDVAERYPEYHIRGFEGEDWPWDSVDWLPSDKRLIVAELLHRQARNAEWEKRKKALLLILSALNAKLVPLEELWIGEEFFGAGIRFQVALEGESLDCLLSFLRSFNCKHVAETLLALPQPDFLTAHRLPDGQVERVTERWKASKGSPVIFEAMCSDLIVGGVGFCWTIEGVLPAGQLGALVAPAKLGKSALGFHLAACVSSGTPFCGLPVKQGKVVVLYGEDSRATIQERWDRARRKIDLSAVDLMFIHAKEFGFSIDKALQELRENVPGVQLVLIDTSATFVPNTAEGGAAREFTNALQAYAEESGASVLFLHHTTKELLAVNARSSKQVFEKFKGSGEFFNAARFVLTLHIEGKFANDAEVLQNGVRVLSIYPGNNISESVARLDGPLKLKMDRASGLLENQNEPVVRIPASQSGDKDASSGSPEPNLSANDGVDVGADARTAAPVILRIQKALGRKLAFGGEKSLFKLRAPGELDDWTRERCQRAHRRAAELGLLT